MTRASRLPAAVLAGLLGASWLAGPAVAGPAAPAPGDSTAVSAPLFGLDDAGLLLFTGVSLAILGQADQHITDQWSADDSQLAHDLSRFGEHFGNPVYSLPLLGVAYVAGRIAHKPGLSASALRISGGMVTAAALAGGTKFIVGRWRPNESPDDPGRFDPFSSHISFPSGHTTVAFSLAAGLDRETRPVWVPCVAYSAAAITAWSRVHDREHWATDVAAGAVLGIWASGKFDRVVRRGEGERVSIEFAPMADPTTGGLASELWRSSRNARGDAVARTPLPIAG